MRDWWRDDHDTCCLADAFVDFDLHVVADCDLIASIGLEAMKSRQLDAFEVVVAQLAMVGWGAVGRWIAISRDRNFYTRTRRYRHPALTYTHTLSALHALSEAGAIEEQRARPSSCSIFQSRYRLTPLFIEKLQIRSMQDLSFLPFEVVKLRDSEKRLIDYRDSAKTRAMRREVLVHNEAIGSIEISLNSPDWPIDNRGLLRNGQRVINPRKLSLFRIFNSGWRYGGRLYGGFWQNLPSENRKQLRIGGAPVVEHDFDFIHPTLMAAIADVDLGGQDPYVLPNFARPLVKSAFNILLNAPTMTSARRAIGLKLRSAGKNIDVCEVGELVQAIQGQHSQFNRFWGTGLGLRLQRIDSDLCTRILARMRAVGVVGLPVHDSFLVPANASGLLLEAMETELDETVRWLSRNPMKI